MLLQTFSKPLPATEGVASPTGCILHTIIRTRMEVIQ